VSIALPRIGCPESTSGCGPLGTLASTRSAHRGRRYPAGAHAGAVGASHRLHCDARAGVAPHNSLRSLRSLRSDRCGESDHEARAAHAPTPALRFSSPQKSPLPGTACREVHRRRFPDRTPPRCQRTVAGTRRGDYAHAEQRSAARGSPARSDGPARMPKASAKPKIYGPARSGPEPEPSQPPSRSEQRREPAAKRRAKHRSPGACPPAAARSASVRRPRERQRRQARTSATGRERTVPPRGWIDAEQVVPRGAWWRTRNAV